MQASRNKVFDEVCAQVELITEASVRFVRSFSTLSQNYQMSILKDELLESSSAGQDNVFIVDVRCPNIQRIIDQVNYMVDVL